MSTGFYSPFHVFVFPGATAYGEFHEWEHLFQDARGSRLFRFWLAHRAVPYVGRFALLAMEAEAAALTLWRLRSCGLLELGDVAEALRGVGSYVRALFR